MFSFHTPPLPPHVTEGEFLFVCYLLLMSLCVKATFCRRCLAHNDVNKVAYFNALYFRVISLFWAIVRGLCCQGKTAASDVGVASPTSLLLHVQGAYVAWVRLWRPMWASRPPPCVVWGLGRFERGLCCLGKTAASDVGVASPTSRLLHLQETYFTSITL